MRLIDNPMVRISRTSSRSGLLLAANRIAEEAQGEEGGTAAKHAAEDTAEAAGSKRHEFRQHPWRWRRAKAPGRSKVRDKVGAVQPLCTTVFPAGKLHTHS